MSNRKHHQGLVALRVQGNPEHGYKTLCLTVPQPTSRAIGHLKGRLFSCELTDDGVLFRLVDTGTEPPGVSLPAWAEVGGDA